MFRKNKSQLRDILFGLKDCTSQSASPERETLNQNLNDSQRSAVDFAESQNEFCMIDGPPGTGKTTVLVEIIAREVRKGRRVLFCGPSNMAVDNMTERLARSGEVVVRVGHPARVTEGCRHHTLEYRLRSQYDTVRDIEARLRTTKRHNRDTDLKQRFERENRKLDLQISECLEEASVVLGTLITCGEGSYHYTKY